MEELKDGAITLISSEVLPTTVACDVVVRNTYEKQSFTFCTKPKRKK